MIFNDPMVVWPEIPGILTNVQYAIDTKEGIIISGGLKGPFKLNGKTAVEDTLYIFKILESNEKPYEVLISSISGLPRGQNYLYILSKLQINGCLTDKKVKTDFDKYLDYLNQGVKNYKTLDEIKVYIANQKIAVKTEDPTLLHELSTQLEEFGFKIVPESTGEYNWLLLDINSNIQMKELEMEQKKYVPFLIQTEGLIMGPILAENAFNPLNLKYYNHLVKKVKSEKIKKDFLQIIVLTLFKMVARLSEVYLDNKLLVVDKLGEHYVTKDSLLEGKNLSVIEKYEILSEFSSPEFINKVGHLAHYKDSNIRLQQTRFYSNFWKKCTTKFPPELNKFVHYLSDFKNNTPDKKYVQTGGNINSNLLFFLNRRSDWLDGLGVYYYEPVEKVVYQLDNTVEPYLSFMNSDGNSDGCLIIGNNIDYISSKYKDFSFKVANLNIGVFLAACLSLKDSLGFPDLKVITQFDESSVKEALGFKATNIILNAIIEV
ncbi:hypothetical protein [Streptococcus sobrinus]|mgnify:CR=1 FL=1|uniref:hypothetical protein n=1 Tax=Streptococcus sobrinus TaxID=1310 RepID=UPI0002D931F7|nr:hypothetical protein [Streptococcus sobrinus]